MEPKAPISAPAGNRIIFTFKHFSVSRLFLFLSDSMLFGFVLMWSDLGCFLFLYFWVHLVERKDLSFLTYKSFRGNFGFETFASLKKFVGICVLRNGITMKWIFLEKVLHFFLFLLPNLSLDFVYLLPKKLQSKLINLLVSGAD